MFGGFILNGYQARRPGPRAAREPDLVRLDVEPLPLAGLFDWPSLVPVALVDRRSSSSSASRRSSGATSARRARSRRRACRAPSSGSAGRPRRSFGNGLPTALAWGLGLGIFGLVIAASGDGVHRPARHRARLRAAAPDGLPGHRHPERRRVPPAPLRRVRADPRRPRRGDARRRPGRPTRPPAGSRCCSRRRSRGRAGWSSGGVGDPRRRSSCSTVARGDRDRDRDGDDRRRHRQPIVGTSCSGAFAAALAGDRHGRRRRVAVELGRARRSRC